ncbi:MAG: hypothetical protein ACPGGK_12970 [Pikeienuella sp.]
MAATRGVYRKGDNVYVFGQSLSDSYTLDLPAASGGGTSTFTVVNSLTDSGVTDTRDIMIGENIGLAIEGNGGWTVTDENADIAIVVDWDDAGATLDFSVMGSNSAETSYGRVSSHSYSTTGTKTVTITSYVYGSSPKTQTVTFDVIDPDSVSWTHEYYCDFNGSTTGMPAEDSVVTHILSHADYVGQSLLSAGDLVRFYFRNGTTHTLAPTSDDDVRLNADIVYFDTFGTGSRAKIFAGGTVHARMRFYHPRVTGQRVCITGYEFDGNWSPVSGVYSGADLECFFNDQDDVYFSMSNCTLTGVGYALSCGQKDNAVMSMYNVRNNATSWQDYIAISGADWFLVQGVEALADPLTGIGDIKTGTSPDWADHAPFRTSKCLYLGADQILGALDHGWSPLSIDRDSQPIFRFHFNDADGAVTGYLASWQRCDMRGSRGIVTGGPNGSSTITSTGTGIIEHCKMLGNRSAGTQAAVLAGLRFGGFVVQNNVCGMADLDHSQTKNNCHAVDLDLQDSTGIATAVQAQPSLVRFNTYFCEYVNSGQDGLMVSEVGANWDLTEQNNLVSVEGMQNAATYLDADNFSTGDDFRPVTGTSADDDVSSGDVPYFDYTHTARGGTTNKGAHDSPSTISTASSPSYTSGLTIASVAGSSTQYQVTDQGTWSNFDPYLVSFDWQVDGADPAAGAAYAQLPYYRVNASDQPGTLTCILTASNFGASTATGTSNGVSI